MKQVVLVGLMATGKSTVGQIVASRTRRRMIDTDVSIASRTGTTVRELWETGGEAAYRSLESDLVLDGLACPDPVVIAAPGGVILNAAVREALSGHHVAWLRGLPTTLAARVHVGDHRPLLGDDPLAVLTQMAADRNDLYARVASVTVDVDDADPDDLAEKLIGSFGLVATR